MTSKVLQPAGWPRPRGYANGISAKGRMVFVSGVIGWNEDGKLVSEDFAAQARQALQNIVTILAEGGAKPEHLARLNWFVLDRKEYVKAFEALGQIYRSVIGSHYPAMTAVEVSGLLEDGARLEIEATAVVPE
jgi:enamine deaminase RidA (YjgF/YER057c/UK114 family)